MSRDSSNRYFDFLLNKIETKLMLGSSLLGKKMENRKVNTHTSFFYGSWSKLSKQFNEIKFPLKFYTLNEIRKK